MPELPTGTVERNVTDIEVREENSQLTRTRAALREHPPLLAPKHAVIAALAAVRPGEPPRGTPEPWQPLFALPFTARRDALRRRLGYTFWTRELADAIASRLAARGHERRVEVAAGAGRFTLELVARGVEVVATDNYDQSPAAIAARRALTEPDQPRAGSGGCTPNQEGTIYPDWVGRYEARDAIRTLQPDLVLVSWPPLGSGMVPSLLADPEPTFSALLFLGEPGGCSEAPTDPSELPPGWQLEPWHDCERFLIGFTDHRFTPSDPHPVRRGRILFYTRSS
jgi:hypothetical protein